MKEPIHIGTAGWTIPKAYLAEFPPEGSHLERYALIFNTTEINSSFYKEHMAKSYMRWAASVPDDFRFSVKLARALIHDCALKPRANEMEASLDNILHLEKKLGVILVQLPASLKFDHKITKRFFEMIRKVYSGNLAIEPRNDEWVSEDARKILVDFKVSKVIADPEKCPTEDSEILMAGGFRYYRLHGSPVIYKSQYSEKFLLKLSRELKDRKETWCIFDNTTFGHATDNALTLKKNCSA
jgi:uncharacterized protein YecE (DUF72 family)